MENTDSVLSEEWPAKDGSAPSAHYRYQQKMLTQQLREMQRDGLIERRDYGEVPPRVEYSLTKHGETLKPLLGLMAAWGTKHRVRYGRMPSEGTESGVRRVSR